MSKYTTEVRYLCEVEYGATTSKGFSLIDDIITTAAPKIFNFDFPIFDENYRLLLEKKILMHYYTREICEETVGLWKLRLQDKLNLIMPYYNQLYSSELLEFNPFYDTDYTRDGNKSDEGQRTNNESESRQSYEEGVDEIKQNTVAESNTVNSSNSFTNTENTSANENVSSSNTLDNSTNSKNTNEESSNSTTSNSTAGKVDKYSDTPQGSIQNIDLTNDAYLTNARIINDTGNETSSGSATSDTTSSGVSNSESSTQASTSENETFTGNTNNSSNSSGNNISSVDDNKTLNSTKNNSTDTAKYKTGTVSNSEEYFERVVGKRGTISNSKLLKEFRETFLNIDKMVIEELNDLFFGLW